MIKKIFGVIIALIAVLVLAAIALMFILPTDFRVEKEITINKPMTEIHDYVKFMKNQNDWGPWVKKDPNIKQNYTGTDGEVGFISAWESDNEEVGKGEQEIKKITADRIETEIRFKAPFEATSDSYIALEETGFSKTNVKWGFTGAMPRPWNLMLLIVDMDKEVGKDFEQGLGNLKKIVESKSNAPEE